MTKQKNKPKKGDGVKSESGWAVIDFYDDGSEKINVCTVRKSRQDAIDADWPSLMNVRPGRGKTWTVRKVTIQLAD